MDSNTVNRAHLLGVRQDNIRHQCPQCGNTPNLFCPYCYGDGLVTEEGLAKWQMQLNATVRT